MITLSNCSLRRVKTWNFIINWNWQDRCISGDDIVIIKYVCTHACYSIEGEVVTVLKIVGNNFLFIGIDDWIYKIVVKCKLSVVGQVCSDITTAFASCIGIKSVICAFTHYYLSISECWRSIFALKLKHLSFWGAQPLFKI